jgi:hypothetical protein
MVFLVSLFALVGLGMARSVRLAVTRSSTFRAASSAAAAGSAVQHEAVLQHGEVEIAPEHPREGSTVSLTGGLPRPRGPNRRRARGDRRTPAEDRAEAAGVVFDVAHPIADAGDDRSAGLSWAS